VGAVQSRAQYQYSLQAIDQGALLDAAPAFEQRLRKLKGLSDVNSDLQSHNPQLEITVDRDRAASLGVDASAVQAALRSAYGEQQVSTIYRSDGQFPVILGVDLAAQNDPGDLDLLTVRNGQGQLIPLSTLATSRRSATALTVNHTEQLPSVTFSFNLNPGVSLDAVTAEIRSLAEQLLPVGTVGSFQGSAKVFEQSVSGLGWLLFAAVLVIYLVLGILYEDLIHPLTILTSLPSAAVGGLATLILFGSELNLYSTIGLVLLIGTVKKNGIMMVDAAIGKRRQGAGLKQAIHSASMMRFRPITMTTVAAIVGTLPIAIGWGATKSSP
jgi:HAE1 family hydrophobic/amphiphilic exporter-1